LFFEADAREPVRWALDGKPLEERDSFVAWEPRRGRHRVALLDRGGEEVHAVNFEVRGGREIVE
jgi:hypothetical protein